MTEKEKLKMDSTLEEHSRRFYQRLMRAPFPAPTFFKLWAFRMGRTCVRLTLDESNRDYTYYRDNGWLQSDYYYPVRLGMLKKAAGSFFDSMTVRSMKKRVC